MRFLPPKINTHGRRAALRPVFRVWKAKALIKKEIPADKVLVKEYKFMVKEYEKRRRAKHEAARV